jgi:YbbR domain-containing protein
VTVDPIAVTVEGDADQLAELVRIETAPVSVAGLSADQTVTAELVLPEGVVVLGSPTVDVTVTVRQVTATRSFEVGIRLVGTSPDLIYEPALGQLVVTIGGSVADLDRLDGSTIVATLDVTDLGPGTTSVPVEVDLPAGLSLVAASPTAVEVTVTQPPSPSPSAAAAPASPPATGG